MKNVKLAQDVLRTLGVYGPYIRSFGTKGACFYESGIGYWAYQEEVAKKIINEVESTGKTVYAVVHGKYEFGELWDVYAFDNDCTSVEEVLEEYGAQRYIAYAYCFDGDGEYVESGDEVIMGRYGGVVRVG